MPLRVGIPYQPYSFLIKKLDGLIVAQDDKGRIKFSGTDASTVIQAAIDALPPGGKLSVGRGEHVIKTTLTNTKPILFEGEGPATVLKVDGGVDITILNLGADYSQVRNIKFVGHAEQTFYKGLLEPANYCLIEGCYFDGARAIEGIRIEGNYNVVTGCWVTKCAHGGIYLYAAEDNVLVGNVLYDTAGFCVYVSHRNLFANNYHYLSNVFLEGGGGGSNENLVIGGVFIGPGAATPGVQYGIRVGGNRNLVIGNLIRDFSGNGIDMREWPSDNLICNNHIRNMLKSTEGWGGYGILSHSTASNNIYLNNYIDTVAADGIEDKGTGNLMVENVLRNITGTPIVPGTDAVVKRNIGHVTENSGVATFSGDGTTTAFTIPHGLAAAPSVGKLEAKTADAAGDKYWAADASNITVTFITAPPAGTDNVVLSWMAEV